MSALFCFFLYFRSYSKKLEVYNPTFFKIRYILEELYVAVIWIISWLIIYIDQLNTACISIHTYLYKYIPGKLINTSISLWKFLIGILFRFEMIGAKKSIKNMSWYFIILWTYFFSNFSCELLWKVVQTQSRSYWGGLGGCL